MESIRSAVLQFARERFTKIAAKINWHLRRMPASGVFGDGHGYKTLWDEYCHEVQNGPHEQLDWAWETVLIPWADHFLTELPAAEKQVLFFATEAYFDWISEDEQAQAPIDDVALRDEILAALQKVATGRDLSRFKDW